MSRQIRDLEEEPGVPLFARNGKSLRLNNAGRIFPDEAHGVLEWVEAASRPIRAMADGDRGEIHVDYAPSLTVGLLPMGSKL